MANADSDSVRNFMGYLWVQKDDNVFTIGINEDGLEDFAEITAVDFPAENEKVEGETVIGSLETDEGTLDIYAPVGGTVVEVNTAVVEDPSLIQDDPYDAWLIKIESDEDMDDVDDEEDEEDDDEDEEEEEEDYGDDED